MDTVSLKGVLLHIAFIQFVQYEITKSEISTDINVYSLPIRRSEFCYEI